MSEPRRILVGFDGSRPARAALAWAEDLARRNHGRLSLVMVANQPWLSACGWPGMAIAPSTAEIETSASALLREAIDSLAPDISVTSVVLSGPVGQALAREARRQDCDVIVVGRGRRLLRRGPSPAERFLRRHADVPVVAITVPSRRAAAAEPTLEPVLAPIRPAL